MTSAEIRQSFLDFFAARDHRIVPSASLLPTAPNLLFTNAGMNPFVPYFLGEQTPPHARLADTQKCIRAGGKHNDLEDVGLDTYHQTLFEMLGNWSFGDYFKEEALRWSWELLTQVWQLPKERLYATVYQPGSGDPSETDAEALAIWQGIFKSAGLDPDTHIHYGGKKDNFWMMGETGPCGPCSEIHIDLTPDNATGGALVNADNPWCIELWNNVFIQYNAHPDGTLTALQQRHVDTGMGFERVAGVFASTRHFTDFTQPPSNYDADLFTPIFEVISELSGQRYGATLPRDPRNLSPDERRDVAFRVLADHSRCLCCGIADGILPGNEGRNYVLRRILRRAVLYGRRLDLPEGFFAQLIDPVLATLGDTFGELRAQEPLLKKVIAQEEQQFAKTLDRGMAEFGKATAPLAEGGTVPGQVAFTLYDTYGFPLDLTQLLAQERGLSVDGPGFEAHMAAQRERARAGQSRTVVTVREGGDAAGAATRFVGYDSDALEPLESTVTEVVEEGDAAFVVTEATPFYAAMGGQLGDTGTLAFADTAVPVADTLKDASGCFLHRLGAPLPQGLAAGAPVTLTVEPERRAAIARHHTATHLLHWALREVLGTHVRQAGSYVGPDRLRFDFAHFEALTPEQLDAVEALCQARILSNDAVRWYELPFADKPDSVLAHFADKYGDIVRIVDIGGATEVDAGHRPVGAPQPGYSAELCGGTHVAATGELGLFWIAQESAVAAGTRRIEALAGGCALSAVRAQRGLLKGAAQQLKTAPEELPQRLDDLLQRFKASEAQLKQLQAEARAAQAQALSGQAQTVRGVAVVATRLEAANPNDLRAQAAKLLQELGEGVVVAGAAFGPKATLVALTTAQARAAGFQAGAIIAELAPKLGGRGGGKPDMAMGGGDQPEALAEVLDGWKAGLS